MRSAAVVLLGSALTLFTYGDAGAQETGAQEAGRPESGVQEAGMREGAVRAPRGEEASPMIFWQSLGDTTLVRLVEEALTVNRDVRATEARSRAAGAQRVEAALDLAPAISATAAYTRQRFSRAAIPGAPGPFPDQDVWDAGLELSWELDAFGRVRNQLEGRDALVDAAEEDARDVRVLVAAEAARAYFDLRGTRDRLAVARRNADNQLRTLELTRDRLEAGSGTALDVERAQAQLSSTLAELPTLEAAIAATRHRIAVLVGREPESLTHELDGAGPSLDLPSELVVSDHRDAVRLRPDVLSAASRLAADRAFVSSAKAAYLPRVSLGGVAGYTANAFGALGDTGTPRYALGAVVSWPFLDLGRVKAGVDEARAHEIEAEARHDQAVLEAREEIETSLTAYHRARERLRHLQDAAAASERATELARLRFEEGGTDFLEVLDAERRQLEAQDRLAAGHTAAVGWVVSVYRATGGASALPGG
jgi:NodT family efflux transporter outer membrane factor (OMF) lipoprotein